VAETSIARTNESLLDANETKVLGRTIDSACAHGKNRLKKTNASLAAGGGRRRGVFLS